MYSSFTYSIQITPYMDTTSITDTHFLCNFCGYLDNSTFLMKLCLTGALVTTRRIDIDVNPRNNPIVTCWRFYFTNEFRHFNFHQFTYNSHLSYYSTRNACLIISILCELCIENEENEIRKYSGVTTMHRQS